MRIGAVFDERLQNDAIFRRLDCRDFFDQREHDLVDGFARERLAGIDVNFARFGVDHFIDCDHRRDRQFGIADELVARCGILHFQCNRREELADDRRRAAVLRVHCPQQRHRREFARLVDANAEGFLLRDVDFDPATALRDDPARVQILVRFALDDEVDARRTVQLADDDALGPVDDELAATDHDRHVAEIDFFLLRGAVRLAQTQPDAERPTVGQTQLTAFVGVVTRLAEFVLDILQRRFLVVAFDRENLAHHPFEAGRGSAIVTHVELQKAVVRASLDFREVRNLCGIAEATEVPLDGWGDNSYCRDGHRSCSCQQTGNRHDDNRCHMTTGLASVEESRYEFRNDSSTANRQISKLGRNTNR